MIEFIELVEVLRTENTNTPREILIQTADWLLLWLDASINVRMYGSIVLDPKTMNRVENPKLKINEKAEKAMNKKPLCEVRRRRAVAAMEASVEAEIEEAKKNETHGNGNCQTQRDDDTDPAAIPGGGKGDCAGGRGGRPLDGKDKRKNMGQGRKKGVSAIPQHLRTGDHKRRVDASEN